MKHTILASLFAACCFAQAPAAPPDAPAAETPKPPPALAPEEAYVRRFSLGGRLGILALGAFKGGSSTENLTVGPTLINKTAASHAGRARGGVTLQVALTERFAVNLDVMFGKTGYEHESQTYTGTDNSSTAVDERDLLQFREQTRANYVELPLLLRYYTVDRHERGRRIFYEGGMALRRTGKVTTFTAKKIYDYKTAVSQETFETCCIETPARPANRVSAGVVVGAGMQLNDDYGIKFVPEVRYTRWLKPMWNPLPGRSNANQLEILIGITF